eukprot:3411879-Rhodomonas_salina.1
MRDGRGREALLLVELLQVVVRLRGARSAERGASEMSEEEASASGCVRVEGGRGLRVEGRRTGCRGVFCVCVIVVSSLCHRCVIVVSSLCHRCVRCVRRPRPWQTVSLPSHHHPLPHRPLSLSRILAPRHAGGQRPASAR